MEVIDELKTETTRARQKDKRKYIKTRIKDIKEAIKGTDKKTIKKRLKLELKKWKKLKQ